MPKVGEVRAGVSNQTPPQEIHPTIRLVAPNVLGDYQGVVTLKEQLSRRPALLVSYVYLEAFLEHKVRYCYRTWAFDSGAYSAINMGITISLDEYTKCCLEMAKDPTLAEIFALDVIRDWDAGIKNTDEMWRRGVPAIPTFHYGEPWDVLLHLSETYPKIALGGSVNINVRLREKWIGQCFARVWPKRIHGFGLCSEPTLMKFPFHSVDATNWEIRPCKYGEWRAFDSQRVSVRGSKQNLRAEVEWYLNMEEKMRVRWRKEMEKIQAADAVREYPSVTRFLKTYAKGLIVKPKDHQGKESPTVRLAMGLGQGERNGTLDKEFPNPKPPTVRLAINGMGQGETNGSLSQEYNQTVRSVVGCSTKWGTHNA